MNNILGTKPLSRRLDQGHLVYSNQSLLKHVLTSILKFLTSSIKGYSHVLQRLLLISSRSVFSSTGKSGFPVGVVYIIYWKIFKYTGKYVDKIRIQSDQKLYLTKVVVVPNHRSGIPKLYITQTVIIILIHESLNLMNFYLFFVFVASLCLSYDCVIISTSASNSNLAACVY